MHGSIRQTNLTQIEGAVRQILSAIGEDPDRDGLEDTPARVARMYLEITSGLASDPATHLATTFEAGHEEIVLVRDIPFSSLCEHHLMPFVGVAHVGYIPGADGRVTGLSKLARVVDGYAQRLQVQERMTTQIIEAIERELDPVAAIVVVEAEHMCMSIRGVSKPGALTITSAVRGLFREDSSARAEAMSLISAHRSR